MLGNVERDVIWNTSYELKRIKEGADVALSQFYVTFHYHNLSTRRPDGAISNCPRVEEPRDKHLAVKRFLELLPDTSWLYTEIQVVIIKVVTPVVLW
jgi:hypothetical protein